MGDGLITDISLVNSAVFALKYSKEIKNSDILFITAPGDAVKDESGIWYYILNRTESDGLIKKHLVPSGVDSTAS